MGCTNGWCGCDCKDKDNTCILCLNDDHQYGSVWGMMADKNIDTMKHFGRKNPVDNDIERNES